MPTYRVVVGGLEDVQVNVPGCSGDALSLALGPLGLSNFKVDRRSQDGRQWVFQATFKPGGVEPPAAGLVTRLVSVDRIDD
jgi:hypothetical protein